MAIKCGDHAAAAIGKGPVKIGDLTGETTAVRNIVLRAVPKDAATTAVKNNPRTFARWTKACNYHC